MVNGLYTASASMMHLQRKQDVAAHNLSNLNTTGFKMSKLLTQTEITIRRNDESKLHQDETRHLNEVFTSFDPGPIVQTDNHLDFALEGPGFFSVMTPDGIRYTRNGSFSLNGDGELVTLNGHVVLQDNEDSIRLDPEEKISVVSDGGVFINGVKRGKIGIFQFPRRDLLLAEGSGYFNNPSPTQNLPERSFDTVIRQGFLEGSNVDMIRGMVEMIAQFRNYEASQKTLHAIDDTLQKAVSEVGRI